MHPILLFASAIVLAGAAMAGIGLAVRLQRKTREPLAALYLFYLVFAVLHGFFSRAAPILAETLLGYCFQTARMVYNVTGWHSSLAVDYATIWKLTLMNYNAGPECTYNTILSTFEFTQGPMRWSDISANVSGQRCFRGLAYANQITAKTFNFPPPD